MARYNTVLASGSTTTTTSLGSSGAGLFTEFTGTAPYTVTLPDPTTNVGITQSFYNTSTGVITISTPTGQFRGPGSSGTASQTMPIQSTMSLASDGTNYVIISENGGPLIATSATTANFTPSAAYDLTPLTYIQTKYGNPWVVKNGAYTAVPGDRLFVDTSAGAVTITLPGSGQVLGDRIAIVDYSGTFQTYNLTVGNNGFPIMRQNTTMTVATKGAAFELVWSGATNGWLMANGI